MLELQELSLAAPRAPEEAWLLHEISARFPPGHLCAIVGPSGCGKSTLLKVIAGVREPDGGAVRWEGRDLEEKDLEPQEIGYVPQFSIAFDLLTVEESIETALRLRVGGISHRERWARTAGILADVGLTEIATRRVHVLSGGQKRRLALALEMVSSPMLLLCDEVTSGLDPKAEDEIVRLLRKLSLPAAFVKKTEPHEFQDEERDEPIRDSPRTVLSVTHSLRHLELHDSVIVLYEGHLVYHGPPQLLTHYFRLENPEDLFPSLSRRSAEAWHRSWKKHRAAYEAATSDAEQEVAHAEDEPVAPNYDVEAAAAAEIREAAHRSTNDSSPRFERPAFFTQFLTLLARRWKIFRRDRGQVALQLALLFGFPCLVVIFALDGLPQIQNLTGSGNAVQQLLDSAAFALQSSRVASLVSGLVMFQVILLTLMGSNNAAREIAGERAIFEKEKFAGVRAASYVLSKAVFLAAVVAAQSIWMAVFVSTICRFPGDLLTQAGVLVLVNAAMTAICLGISSVMASAEQASLVSVYLVGFQLPLSGAVLALPQTIGWITRPFIAAYWGWSGYLQTMRDTRFYDVVQSVSQTSLSAPALCCWVLGSHIAGGLLLAYLGSKHSRWQ